MREHGLPLTGPLVLATMAERKTQTRRLPVWPAACGFTEPGDDAEVVYKPDGWIEVWRGGLRDARFRSRYGAVGGRLWVREAWTMTVGEDTYSQWVKFRADDSYKRAPDHALVSWRPGWHPSIHMPRWASRILLERTGGRIERVQDISGVDVIAEGVDYERHRCGCEACGRTSIACTATEASLVQEFAQLWDEINGKRAPWASNPLVEVVEFCLLEVAGRAA